MFFYRSVKTYPLQAKVLLYFKPVFSTTPDPLSQVKANQSNQPLSIFSIFYSMNLNKAKTTFLC